MSIPDKIYAAKGPVCGWIFREVNFPDTEYVFLREGSGWINVRNKVPDGKPYRFVPVLICNIDKNVFEAVYNTKTKQFQTKDFIKLDMNKIIYWMPMIKPPEIKIIHAQFDEPCPHCGKMAIARFKGEEDEFWEHQQQEADDNCPGKSEGKDDGPEN